MLAIYVHVERRSNQRVMGARTKVHVETRDTQLRERVCDHALWHAEIDQRSDDHVACKSTWSIQIENHSVTSPLRERSTTRYWMIMMMLVLMPMTVFVLMFVIAAVCHLTFFRSAQACARQQTLLQSHCQCWLR
jgi:hypothetical protein